MSYLPSVASKYSDCSTDNDILSTPISQVSGLSTTGLGSSNQATAKPQKPNDNGTVRKTAIVFGINLLLLGVAAVIVASNPLCLAALLGGAALIKAVGWSLVAVGVLGMSVQWDPNRKMEQILPKPAPVQIVVCNSTT